MKSLSNILDSQLADDFCCSVADILSSENVFTVFSPQDGRRRFGACEHSFLKVACIYGKLVFTGSQAFIKICRERFEKVNSAWFMEYRNLAVLDDMLRDFGYGISQAHPFYIAKEITPPPECDGEVSWHFDGEIEQFRGDTRFNEAFAFSSIAPDRIGVALKRDGDIIGMAGASEDSARMWQIGINVDEAHSGEHIGTYLVTLLKNKLIEQNILPFYGTSVSHIASQNVALRSGFHPAWAELCSEPLSN